MDSKENVKEEVKINPRKKIQITQFYQVVMGICDTVS